MTDILNIGTDDMTRPYERCLAAGPESLTDAELIAVIIRTGTKDLDCVKLAGRVLDLSPNNKNLIGLCHLDLKDLMTLPGIGRVKAVQLKCVVELSKRISAARAMPELSFNNPSSIAEYYYEKLRHEEKEHFICMMMDIKNHLIGEAVISTGTVNASLVSTREIFLEALRFHAANIIVIHNHPSGDPSPSQADDEVTMKIYEAGELINIPLVDHVIIGDRDYYSYKEQGFIP